MAKPKGSSKKNAKNSNKLKSRALNAFNIAVDDEEYITGTRQQQDIDLEDFADKRIKDLLDGAVKPEDDEELDSDELVGDESDYGLEAGEPGSDWGESFDESELVPLSTALDMAMESDDDNDMSSDEGAQFDKEPSASIQQSQSPNASDSDGVSEEEESDSDADDESHDDDSQDSDIFSNSDSDSEPEDSTAVLKAIGKINDKSITARAKLDKFAVPENPNMMPSRDAKLSLDDLTSSSKNELKLLKSKVKPKTLEMPLPERIKARGDRAAAYELAKEEVTKWEDTVKENRRAEHLSFPINAPAPREAANPFVPAAEANELETKVNDLLEKSQIKDEKALSAFEETAPSNLTFEEMKKRRQELRMIRELMFREEQKAKRIKKIKSKSYRRVHKKEREKQEQLLRDAGEISDDDPEEASRKRALERASLKHKTTSKWAKRMIDTGMSKDESTRAELDAMLQQGETLRSRVIGAKASDDDSDSDDGSEVFQLHSDDEDQTPKKGLMGMKFMQNAEKRQREANKKLMYRSGDEDESEVNIGRRSYGPGRNEIAEQAQQSEKRAQEEAELDDEKAMSNRLSKKHKRSRQGEDRMELRYNNSEKSSGYDAGNADADAEAAANPWLNISAQKNQSTFQSIDKDSSQAAKAASKLSKAKGKGKKGNSNVDIDVNDTLNLGMMRKDQLTFEQRDLIRKAFAGDDVVAEFEAEKAQTIEEDGDKEVDETLPGWGSWGGEGLKPKVQRIRHVKGVDAKKRKDYKKDGVIISEKLNKKINRYAASAVPFPYENAAQYERSLNTPIGNEWATRDTFQRQTKPRIMVKKGEIIDPIKRKS